VYCQAQSFQPRQGWDPVAYRRGKFPPNLYFPRKLLATPGVNSTKPTASAPDCGSAREAVAKDCRKGLRLATFLTGRSAGP
jgi:hypothetical protein